jgi:uncharacterized protein (TIGR00369 family)
MTWATDRLDALKSGTATPPPVVRTLQLGMLDDWGRGWARKRWTPQPDLLNIDGSMFGGYITALADQVAAFATLSVLEDGEAFRTLNLNTSFFKVGRSDALDIEGRVVVRTKSIVAVEVQFIRQGGELIAKATAHQAIVPLPAPPAG